MTHGQTRFFSETRQEWVFYNRSSKETVRPQPLDGFEPFFDGRETAYFDTATGQVLSEKEATLAVAKKNALKHQGNQVIPQETHLHFDEVAQAVTEEKVESEEPAKKSLGEPAALLQMIPLLEGLQDDQLTTVSGQLVQEKYSDGQVIVSQGHEADKLYLIKSGKVRVTVTSSDGEAKEETVT